MTRGVRSGMTLMELVVGLAITGVMAATGAAAFGSIIDHRRTIKASTVDIERASALRSQLRLWINSGTVLIQVGGVPRMGSGGSPGMSPTGAITAAAAAGDELTVNTTAANPANAPNARMRIFVDGDAGTPETGLAIEYMTGSGASTILAGQAAAVQAAGQAVLQRRQLEPSIGSMKVEFLDQRTGRWRPASEAAAMQPIAVRLTLLPLEGHKLPAILELPLVLATSIGVTVNRQGQPTR